MARHNQQQKAQQYRVYGNELSMTGSHGRSNGCSPQNYVKQAMSRNEAAIFAVMNATAVSVEKE